MYSSCKGNTKEICPVKIGFLSTDSTEGKRSTGNGLEDNSNNSGDSDDDHFV